MWTSVPRQKQIVIAGAVLLLSLFMVAKNVAAASDPARIDKRLVTIYDQDQERTIITAAGTVKEALDQAKIEVGKADKVEPAASSKLIAKNYRVNIYRARPVTLVDGGQRIKLVTSAQSPKQIFAAAGLTLYDEDQTSFARTENVVRDGGAGLKLTVKRATPFLFTLYGKQFQARTQAATVGAMLKEKGIVLGSQDGSSLPLATPLTTGMDLRIWRNGKQTLTQEEIIAKTVEQVKDMDRDLGFKEVRTPGQDGKKQVTYEIEMRNGQEVSRRAIASVTTLEPVKEVVVIGGRVKGAYTTPSENETITWNYLLAQGFSRNQTAGIMGNLKQEHGFNTTGDGLAQWTGGRKANLLSRPDPYNIYTQLDFLMWELNGGYAAAKNEILASSTVEGAVRAFQNKFERCGVCAEGSRIQFAYNILASH